ncbi:hypothetical protein [Clostridium ihumii]|uniref:hypothetical protein n=1 Tax=Clostridium ihumii TaxID=1470356 RepID=UPI0005900921|nr:hypothetical protein [Clostridium ihumii]
MNGVDIGTGIISIILSIISCKIIIAFNRNTILYKLSLMAIIMNTSLIACATESQVLDFVAHKN